jgi:hypothetical protein
VWLTELGARVTPQTAFKLGQVFRGYYKASFASDFQTRFPLFFEAQSRSVVTTKKRVKVVACKQI